MLRALLFLAASVMLAVHANARDDDNPIKVKLEKAKAAFAAEESRFLLEIDIHLEKREAAARKAGDKKAVDVIKAERKAFEERSEIPATTPKAAKQSFATAKAAMEKAYTVAVKEYTRAKMDDSAATVEKEFDEFKKGINPTDTRRKWVHDKGSYTRLQNGKWEEKSPDGKTYEWKETARTKDHVELQATIFGFLHTVRLTSKTAEYQYGKGTEFKTQFTGKWAN